MDSSEGIRRVMVEEINAKALDRAALEKEHGRVWSTDELCAEFEIRSFLAPFVNAVRRSDGVKVVLEFQHSPRFYYGLSEV